MIEVPDPAKLPVVPKVREFLVALKAKVDASWPTAGINAIVTDIPGGKGRSIGFPGVSGGGQTTIPFALRKVDNTTIRVLYGTVNNVVPTGMSLGDAPIFTTTVSGNGHVYLDVTMAANSLVPSSVVITDGASVPTSTDTHGYFSLGTFATDAGVLTVTDGPKAYSCLNGNGAWVFWT